MLEIMALTGIGIYIMWYLDRHRREQGFLFYRTPLMAKRGTFGSAPNPENVIQGYVWSDYRDVKDKFDNEKNIVFLDNFRFFDHFVKKSYVRKKTKKKIEETEIWLDPRKLTQGVLLLGATGTGKSEMYYSLLNQKWYKRALIHDIKQDFIKRYYRKNRDIIYNAGLDERSWIWNFLDEAPQVQESFFTNLLSSMLGEKKDYFSQAAQKKYTETTKAIFSIYYDESVEKKWMLFITAIKDLIHSMEKGESKSDSDVSKTMDQILELFEMNAYFIIKGKRKTFTIADFFAKDKQSKLFLSNVEAYASGLRPIFTGFIAAFTMVHASMDSYAAEKGNFTFYLLDEYLGFVNFMDENTVDRIHLRLRSFGCCPISALQKLPKKEELKDTLTSSNYLLIYFATSEGKIVKNLKDTLGKTDYWYETENSSVSEGKKTNSTSKQQNSMSLISDDMIHGLGEDYSHITFFPLLKTVYKGYTPLVQTKERVEGLISADLKEFYQTKFQNFTVREIENFEDIFDKPLSKLDEYRLQKKLIKAKQQGEEALKRFKRDNGLEAVNNLDLLFKKWLPDKTVIANKMKMYKMSERFELFTEWSKILGDDEKELEFIEKNELQGAMPGFFDDLKDMAEDA